MLFRTLAIIHSNKVIFHYHLKIKRNKTIMNNQWRFSQLLIIVFSNEFNLSTTDGCDNHTWTIQFPFDNIQKYTLTSFKYQQKGHVTCAVQQNEQWLGVFFSGLIGVILKVFKLKTPNFSYFSELLNNIHLTERQSFALWYQWNILQQGLCKGEIRSPWNNNRRSNFWRTKNSTLEKTDCRKNN